MERYCITHADTDGVRHQLAGAWEAATPDAAISQMLLDAGADDDGCWEAHVVVSDVDIIE